MLTIDRDYFQFKNNVYAADTGIASFADFAQLGLTTAASAIPLAQTTKILAVAATGVGGGKAVYNQDLLRAQTLQALATQMDADRTNVKNTILFRMANCDAGEYPWGLAFADLQAYADAGTTDSAITSLSHSATQAKQAASSPTSTASPGGSSGGPSPSDPNAKIVSVNGGTLTYSFKATNQCPLKKTPPKPPAPPKAQAQLNLTGTITLNGGALPKPQPGH
jgi:hypothetical protein